jgi:hypothetical protein
MTPCAPAPFASAWQLVLLLARQARPARRREAPEAPAGVEHRRGDPERGAAEDVADVVQLQPVAQVRPVDAVALHRLGVRHAPERGRHPHAGLGEQRLHQPLGEGDDVVLTDERGLDVDLRELGLPVGPQVLVPEAARNLEVAVEARDHEQLLVDLRALR